jgi:hypothetical protein
MLGLGLILSSTVLAEGQKPKRSKPPQEALDACIDKSEGDSVQFTTPRGDDLAATCEYRGDSLVAVPENHKRRKKEEKN